MTINSFGTVSNRKGYHVYRGIWVPKIGKMLLSEREPVNFKDKYAVCVKKNEYIVRHLPPDKTGNFAKTLLRQNLFTY